MSNQFEENDKVITKELSKIKSVSDNAETVFLNNSSREIDFGKFNTYKALIAVIIVPILLSWLVILVPLGGFSSTRDDDEIDPTGYIIFQLVYNLVAYNCLVRPMAIPLIETLPLFYIWIILPYFVGFWGIFLIYYLLIANKDNAKPAKGTIYLYGVLYFFVSIWISFFYGCYKMDKLKGKGKNNTERLPAKTSELKDVPVTNNPINLDKVDQVENGHVVESERPIKQEGTWTASLLLYDLFFHHQIPYKRQIVLCSYTALYFRALIMSMVLAGMYAWCSWFTTFYALYEETSYSSILVIMFLSITGLATILARALGSRVDRCISAEAPSLNVIAGLMADSFLVIFTINLFSLVDNWGQFFLFNFFSSLWELVVYQLTLSEMYENLHDRILVIGKEKMPTSESPLMQLKYFLCLLYSTGHGWKPGKILVARNALHVSYRSVMKIGCSISYIIFQIFLRYGYNSPYYDSSVFTDDEFGKLMGYIVVSVIIDAIVTIPADRSITKRTGISLSRRFLSFFDFSSDHGRVYIGFFIWVFAHIISDVFVAKINYKTQANNL